MTRPVTTEKRLASAPRRASILRGDPIGYRPRMSIDQTPRNALERVPDMPEAVVEKEAQTRFDPAHVTGFGACSLAFEVMNRVRQAINLGFERLASFGATRPRQPHRGHRHPAGSATDHRTRGRHSRAG